MIETLKKYGFFKYGKVIPGLEINGKPAPYPVLNERAIRAGAGIMFLLGGISFAMAFLVGDFTWINYVVIFFFLDFLAKVVIGTRFSLVSTIANLAVKGQKPEYVGAVQKRFAWSIGLTMSGIMILLIFGFGIMGTPNLVICLTCLTFMWLETSFGICVGCKIYYGLISLGVIKEPEIAPACPGGMCPMKKRS